MAGFSAGSGNEEFQQLWSKRVGGHVVCLARKDAVNRTRDGSGDCFSRVGQPCGASRGNVAVRLPPETPTV